MRMKKILFLLLTAFAFQFTANAQITTSGMSGTIKNAKNEALIGATIKATHTPTGTVYNVQSRANGRFDITNMNNGGPYKIEVSYVNYGTEVKDDIFLSLGEVFRYDFTLNLTSVTITEVTVAAKGRTNLDAKGGTSSSIGRDRIDLTTAVGRNIQDYIKVTPFAKTLNGNEGAVTIAGQNNRYNSFYIDGAINNDVFGLAASGTNGGQTAGAPISIDAIDQFQIMISPYDASIGNFTGGGINAVTKSGTNNITGSVYYFYRNEKLAGKNPLQRKDTAQRFPEFKNKTFGFTVGGPIIKNKLFFFASFEQQRDATPQIFDFSTYRGNTNTVAGVEALKSHVKSTYGYEMGEWQQTTRRLDADRVVAKIDWNISPKHRFTVSGRYNKLTSESPSISSSTSINFTNGGVRFPHRTTAFSAELKSNLTKNISNRLLATYSDVLDDRSIVGDPFPRIALNDNGGTITFGGENSSTQNLLTQKNLSIVDNLKINYKNHSFTLGVDYERFKVFNVFIQNSYGNYSYLTTGTAPNIVTGVQKFIANNVAPSTYQLGFPNTDKNLNDETGAGARFTVSKLAFFIADEMKVGNNLTINMGVRADHWKFITTPYTDAYTNDSAIVQFAKYYDLKGARSGQKPKFPLSISPRLGFTYKIPDQSVTIRGGIGMFTGRMPLVWPGGTYNNNGYFVGGYTASAAALTAIRFRWNPADAVASVWTPAQVGQGFTKGPLNLISKEFKMPKLVRASMAFDKNFGKGWTGTFEVLVSKNMNEIYYTNINILPPIGVSLGAGPRTVYGVSGNNTAVIPIANNGTGTNPYDNAILVSNNSSHTKGFAYNLNVGIEKRSVKGINFSASYAFGNSMVGNEGTSSVNFSQWRFIESVNGRNTLGLSPSDFDQAHRILSTLSKKFTYLKGKLATTISLTYIGQSGAPLSYTYVTSMTRDDGTGGGNDLMYIPTAAELQGQTFLANTVSGVTYTPQQQKDALEAYITKDKYLSKNRGKFADRNGARLPFTPNVDLKLAQDFTLKFGKKSYQLQLTWEIYNFTNMLNRDWGKQYFAGNDQFALVTFAGYVAANNLTPQYRFNPTVTTPYNFNNSATPGYANRWVSTVGLRFNFK
ncbi:MAG: TonB-dependent receptor [Chitinophagaceae bacterium]|nr:TonB-dependent receptor [Chitinophagaceae bacterium]